MSSCLGNGIPCISRTPFLITFRYGYDLGHRGTCVTTCGLTHGEAQVALAIGYIPWSADGEEAWNALHHARTLETGPLSLWSPLTRNQHRPRDHR